MIFLTELLTCIRDNMVNVYSVLNPTEYRVVNYAVPFRSKCNYRTMGTLSIVETIRYFTLTHLD